MIQLKDKELIKYIELQGKIKFEYETRVNELKKQLDHSDNNILRLLSINNELQNKIDKAIEFIENDKTIVGKDITGELYEYELKILNILKGENDK